MLSEMQQRIYTVIASVFVAGIFGILLYGVWKIIYMLTPELLGKGLAGLSVVLAAVMGYHFTKMREVEAHFRPQKAETYSKFLEKILMVFHSNGEVENDDLVKFLQGWQQEIILWGGAGVCKAYLEWKNCLTSSIGNPDVQSIFFMDELFKAMRKDLGLSNRNMKEKGYLSAYMLMKNPDLFLGEAKKNPKVTLAEISKKEEALGLAD